MPRPSVPFNVVLVNPEIPQNTGNIARLCAATGSRLHLVGRLGFSIDEKAVRRAGLDYWHLVDVQHHQTFDQCMDSLENPVPFLFTTGASMSFVHAPYKAGGVLVFGAESNGLPAELMDRYRDNSYGIPTISRTVRSLNLGNATAIVVYKALEVVGALDEHQRMP